jgi:anti-anti-sigma regulatory factor
MKVNSRVRDGVIIVSVSGRVLLARRMGEHGGRLALCGLSPQIRRTFEVVGCDRVLDICENLKDALKAVSESS